ncbi:hypothetical protein DOTSEDRAFT_89487 [Dothistroma septosporum NZE10]|uniref:Transmembrane protein UsgS n=1 Tax=Dothistroma septosporum (strain NZE10 / CBS 128990) TaxID=675120 RepID=N1PHU8_DOTSN|nr:hypothetical protein DOTSEDRAFT_89487 [Dothistroma septosporum NZE10]
MSNYGSFGSFELNSIVRGAQLTLVGANRAIQNPKLFSSEHYKQAALAVAAGIAIRLLVAIPTLGIRVLIRFLGLFTDLSASTWDEDIIDGIEFIEHSVLQVPFFLMSFMRYLSPAMDQMFMNSLQWVDQTYIQKHKTEDPSGLRAMYYPNLRLYSEHAKTAQKKNPKEAMSAFFLRFGKKAGLSLGIYLLSFIPYVGRIVLPAASFYTFNKAVGLQPAVLVFGSSLFLPKRYLVMFLQSYFSSRSLMRELLDPYFSRIRYTSEQKRKWFHDREGVLYGFALAFFVFLKIPLLGVLMYGVAEASTAYLITKITEPPPAPAEAEEFKKRDVRWENKHEFLSLPLDALDKFNTTTSGKQARPDKTGNLGKQFT